MSTTTAHPDPGETAPPPSRDPGRAVEPAGTTSGADSAGADEAAPAYNTDRGLDLELAAVTTDLGRTEPKAGLILTLCTAVIAGVALLPKLSALALVLAAIGMAAILGSAALSVLVVMPRLDRSRTTGFTRWAREEPEQIRAAVAVDRRPERIRALSQICEWKMNLLVWASASTFIGIAAVGLAAIVTKVAA
ncbi:Pycsar system effector family protein [Kitasatospora purpeofusca]|uniref:Pycsar system effector family protein n=1 Tax=Kitasatospora purpeofusca TaxID=67352 RepID=UPI0035DFB7F5